MEPSMARSEGARARDGVRGGASARDGLFSSARASRPSRAHRGKTGEPRSTRATYSAHTAASYERRNVANASGRALIYLGLGRRARLLVLNKR
eukprot:28754-Pelagococcus_subviridis.AAC.3